MVGAAPPNSFCRDVKDTPDDTITICFSTLATLATLHRYKNFLHLLCTPHTSTQVLFYIPSTMATMDLSPTYETRFSKFKQDFGHILKTFLPFHNNHINDMQGNLEFMPNVLIYGAHGFPLELVWREGLLRRFGVNSFSPSKCSWGKDTQYMETPYYIHLDFESPFVPSDLNELQDFLKSVITTGCIANARHIIVLENIDSLIERNININAFRILLERFSHNAWFVCTTYHISKLEAPIVSRFQCMRIPLPTEREVSNILAYVDGDADGDADEGGAGCASVQTRNIMSAFIMPRATGASKSTNGWKYLLAFPPVGDYIISADTGSCTIEGIRSIVYKAFQCGVSVSRFALDIIETLVKRGVSADMISRVVSEFARYEHMCSQSKGGCELLYMEYMLHYAMCIATDTPAGKIKIKNKK